MTLFKNQYYFIIMSLISNLKQTSCLKENNLKFKSARGINISGLHCTCPDNIVLLKLCPKVYMLNTHESYIVYKLKLPMQFRSTPVKLNFSG